MKKIIILLCFTLLVLNGFIKIPIFADDSELLILQNNAQLKSDPDSLKTVKELQMFENVKMVNYSLIKGHIQVKKADGITGWVLEKYTTYITDEWKEHKFDSVVSIMLPKDQKFTVLEEKKYPANNNSKTYIERKLYNKNYFIRNVYREENLEENLKNDIKPMKYDISPKPIFKKISFKDFFVYFCDNQIDQVDAYGSPIYMIWFEGKNNDSYFISIVLYGADKTEDYYLIARKILFSMKRNP